MIIAVVAKNSRDTVLTFPCGDQEMFDKLKENNTPENLQTGMFYVREITDPSMLCALNGELVNLDELNFLAKRMESFDSRELLRFYSAAHQECIKSLKELINLTFNLQRYTLIQDVSSMEAVGRNHLLTKNMAMDSEELADNEKMAAAGMELLASGKGIPTAFGLLFRNDDVPYEEVYDGQNFPFYDYSGDTLVYATLEYRERNEYLYLPCDDLAIDKAMHRLGAPFAEDASVTLEDCNMCSPEWFSHLKELVQSEDIYAVNHLVRALNTADMDLEKLQSVVEYTGVTGADDIASLAMNLKQFTYFPNACDYEDIGQLWVEEYPEYAIHPEMDEYFNYEGFGKHIMEEFKGRFLSRGFVCMEEPELLSQILHTEDDESMQMGGM